LVLVLHLIGFPLPIAQNLLYVLSILGSALAAYLLARDLFGPQAGLVAAIAYAYAPYQFLDALIRGNAPESLALPLMPLILWAFRRLALTGRRRWFFFSVGFLAALYLTHNISSLLFTPLLIGLPPARSLAGGRGRADPRAEFDRLLLGARAAGERIRPTRMGTQ
jgi:asparagine N-glycosylation enzyme membrane subunit Stt3